MTWYTDALEFIVTIIFTFTCKNRLARLCQVCNFTFLIAKQQKSPQTKGGEKTASAKNLQALWKLSLQALRFWNVAPS